MALGDDRLLQVGCITRRSDHTLQGRHQAVVCNLQIAPDARQRLAGRIEHLAPLVDAASNFLGDVIARVQTGGQIGQVRRFVVQTAQGPQQCSRPQQCAAHVEQFSGAQGRIPFGLVDQWAHVVDTAQVECRHIGQEAARFGRFRLPFLGLAQVIRRQQRHDLLLATGELRELGQAFQDFVVLQQLERFWVHDVFFLASVGVSAAIASPAGDRW